MSIVSLLMGAAHRVDSVVGRTSWNADDYGPIVTPGTRRGSSRQFVAENGWSSFVAENSLEALVADVGLTVEDVKLSPPTPTSRARTGGPRRLAATIPAGRVLGVVDRASIATHEGPSRGRRRGPYLR